MTVQGGSAIQAEIEQFMRGLRRRNPGEPEFHQAVEEVVQWIIPFCHENPRYQEDQILERMTEPDRVVDFPGDMGGPAWQPSGESRLARSVQQRNRTL